MWWSFLVGVLFALGWRAVCDAREPSARDGADAESPTVVRERLVVGTAPERARHARRLLLGVAQDHPRVTMATFPAVVAKSPHAWTLEVWIDIEAAEPDRVASDLRFAIADAFKREGVPLRPPVRRHSSWVR